MQVSKEEILHIANLARLDLNENEVDKYIDTPVIFLTAFCYFLSLFASVPFSRADASRSSSTPV